MTTPHINAQDNAFAKTVIMSGDPLRAKYIAEKFLENAVEVTNVRGMLGFTGKYKGIEVSTMGHGMGIPSASIYTKELITEYNVENIIRVGTCGAVSPDIKVRDIIIAMGACTDSGVNRTRFNGYDFAPLADYQLLENAVNSARQSNTKVHVGNIFSADLFYNPDPAMFDYIEKYGVLGVEMEIAGIYGVAAEYKAKALGICTVSDHIRTHEQTTAEERQTTFNGMIEIALNSLK